jgi:hypothetical protein
MAGGHVATPLQPRGACGTFATDSPSATGDANGQVEISHFSASTPTTYDTIFE